jgi:hypothetical protein
MATQRRTLARLVIIAFLLSTLTSGFPMPRLAAGQDSDVDPYGGWRGLTVPGGATGFFRTAQVGDRWLLVTPEGHPFWMLAVYNINPAGKRAQEKYSTRAAFATHAAQRLRAWGFNAIGEYSSYHLYPIAANGATGANREKLPFMRIVRPSEYSLRPNIGVKDIVAGTDPGIYTGWRGTLPDFFDPKFEQFAKEHARPGRFTGTLETSPWLIGTTVDDADNLRGFKRRASEHPVWLIAVTNPQQSQRGGRWPGTYADVTVYSKLAWRDFLRTKYGIVARLNAAWGASYTTFESDGGWPMGRGLLDESGRGKWLRTTDFETLADVPKPVVDDLEAFLPIFADRYFSVVTSAVRAATPNHLVFGPAALKDDARPAVLRVAAKYVDVLHAYAPSELPRFYDIVKKPVVFWLGLTAQADSPLSAFRNSKVDYPTQSARGRAYGEFMDRLVNLRASDQSRFVVGVDWWEWADNPGERLNWGLVTHGGDNAYDGKEAVAAVGVNAWGYQIGGESRNYGDFLSAVIIANRKVWVTLRTQLAGHMRP